MQRSSDECCSKNSPNIVQNFGAVMATYIFGRPEPRKSLNPCLFLHNEIETPGVSNATGLAISCLRFA